MLFFFLNYRFGFYLFNDLFFRLFFNLFDGLFYRLFFNLFDDLLFRLYFNLFDDLLFRLYFNLFNDLFFRLVFNLSINLHFRLCFRLNVSLYFRFYFDLLSCLHRLLFRSGYFWLNNLFSFCPGENRVKRFNLCVFLRLNLFNRYGIGNTLGGTDNGNSSFGSGHCRFSLLFQGDRSFNLLSNLSRLLNSISYGRLLFVTLNELKIVVLINLTDNAVVSGGNLRINRGSLN